MDILVEAVELLTERGKTVEDVQWVGTADGRFSLPWDEFVRMLHEGEFNPEDDRLSWAHCVIVGDGWWLVAEYDNERGQEYWAYHQMPQMGEAKPFRYSRSGFVARVPLSDEALSEEEVLHFLRAVERGVLSVSRDPLRNASGLGLGYFVASNGWRLVVFESGSFWYGISSVQSSDGRSVGTDYLCEHMPRVRDYRPSAEVLQKVYGYVMELA